jgi:hypothetical protein
MARCLSDGDDLEGPLEFGPALFGREDIRGDFGVQGLLGEGQAGAVAEGGPEGLVRTRRDAARAAEPESMMASPRRGGGL